MKFDIHPSIVDDLLNNSNTDIRLLNIFRKRYQDFGILDKPNISSFTDACNILGLHEPDLIKPDYDYKHEALTKLTVIIEALNDGWKPDLTDRNQKKWYNWFHMENGEFMFYDTNCTSRHMYVPSALHFKSEELAIYCKDNFIDSYKQYYL